MKTCMILSFVPLERDPRVNRQVNWLKSDFQIMTLGPSQTAIPGIPCLDFGHLPQESRWKQGQRAALLLSHQYEAFYWQARQIQVCWRRLQQFQPDLIVANEIETLPLAIRAARKFKSRVLFDAHEFYPGAREHDRRWRWLFRSYIEYLCRRYIPQADARITTSQTMAEYYQRYLGIDKMHIVSNAPAYLDIQPGQTDPERIRLVHHGLFIPDRHPEAMLEMMRHLDSRFELYLMFMDNRPEALEAFKVQARFSDRIHFVPPVPMPKIAQAVSAYDIGVHIISPLNRNHECALANKFFEFLQGRLALAVSPVRELEQMVRTYDLGVVAQDFTGQALAHELNRLSVEDIQRFRQNAHHLSQELCAERSGKVFQRALAEAFT